MFQVLAETAAATNHADGGANALAMILLGAVFFFIVFAVIGWAANGGGVKQPTSDGAHVVSRPTGRAPINLDIEIGELDVMRGPGASSGPRRPLN
jgi:hypothetical protein